VLEKGNKRGISASPGVASLFFNILLQLAITGLISRLVFVFFNPAATGETNLSEITYALAWGIRFDLATAGTIALLGTTVYWMLIRLYLVSGSGAERLARSLMIGAMSLVILLQLGDAMYYADAGRHVSYEIRDAMTDAAGLTLTAFTQHWLFILACLAGGALLVAGLLRLTGVIESKLKGRMEWKLRFGLQHEVSMLVVMVVAILCIRGGPGGVPQSVVSAYKIGNAQQAVVAMNGAYSIIYGTLNSARDAKHIEISLPENINRSELMRDLYAGVPQQHGLEKHEYNIVFIFMEGWPAELMQSYGFDKQTTPFFDSLLDKSFAPRGVIAGGRRTTEGLFATLCSQQNPLGQTVTNTRLQNMPYTCLPHILKQNGWSTSFFQGTHKDTSGTGAFAQRLGFSDSYGKEDMPDGRYKRGSWGAHDPDIYDFMLDKMDHMQQPFFVGVNTNSTHDIEVPDGVDAVFGKDTKRNKKLSTLHFADSAMAEFFEKVSSRPYFSHTIFVLMSDHSSGRGDRQFSRYLIPGLIYAKNLVPAKRLGRYVSQRDVAPTILDILGIAPSASFSGKSFWQDSNDVYFADYYDAGTVNWLQGNMLVVSNINQPHRARCFNIAGGLLDAPETRCGKLGGQLSLESLVFTDYSQQMLFTGRTREFYSFLPVSSVASMQTR